MRPFWREQPACFASRATPRNLPLRFGCCCGTRECASEWERAVLIALRSSSNGRAAHANCMRSPRLCCPVSQAYRAMAVHMLMEKMHERAVHIPVCERTGHHRGTSLYPRDHRCSALPALESADWDIPSRAVDAPADITVSAPELSIR